MCPPPKLSSLGSSYVVLYSDNKEHVLDFCHMLHCCGVKRISMFMPTMDLPKPQEGQDGLEDALGSTALAEISCLHPKKQVCGPLPAKVAPEKEKYSAAEVL
eukprot:CAMPEP_0113946462 /NCGR_PEP_ID=MMETSP1339-20121228/57640_1 /TAXON_ID=94617 /ORGANISM="Fibrocapsa japonica" /LENGTH=101 /DNA_ID=CAMNT_0000952549 /DNA_START=73 /DNA_END=378 /DNA_ORIENTATION=+ /assembly_acc=CAM_ASM_000762